jgi:hypothetical protein
VDKRRFGDSSIFIKDLSKVYDETLRSSNEICLYDHPALQELKKSRTARFRVYLTRLEPRIQIYKDESMTEPLAVSRDLAENTIAQGETGGAEPQLSEGFLFDASGVGQVMCLGVGRYPHNVLRPYMGDDIEGYYREPDRLDPDALCGQISRDHGLVFLDEKAQIYFRDFGTKKEQGRQGSKNGTWVNGSQRIQDVVIPWKEGEYLGLGGRAWVRREGELVKEHVFKLRYERVG